MAKGSGDRDHWSPSVRIVVFTSFALLTLRPSTQGSNPPVDA